MKCPNTICPNGEAFCETHGCFALGGFPVEGRMTDEDHAAAQPYYDAVGNFPVTITPRGKSARKYRRFMRKMFAAYTGIAKRKAAGWRRHIRQAKAKP